MLIRFAVENHLSLKAYSELSLVASSLTDEGIDLIRSDGFPEALLPAVAIYGPNASGKSNLIFAIRSFRHDILFSHRDAASSSGTGRTPFLLDAASRSNPTRFDADFLIDGTRYHYGYTCDDERFIDEWLYAFPKGRRQTWFLRNSDDFEFGKNFPGKNRTISEFTGPRSLFLSSAASNNHELISPIYEYVRDGISYYGGDNITLMEEYLSNESSKKMILDFLSRSDFGVSDISIKERKLSDRSIEMINEFIPIMQRTLNLSSPDRFMPMVQKEPQLGHRGENGQTFYLNWNQESQGTTRLVSMLGPIMDAMARGKILLIDEIDSSLHSMVSSVLIKAFGDGSVNRHRAQVIFSTHDTNLLCSGCLRRDQIWFTEKSNEGATSLYPLTDIATRKTDNIERGYLQGRYGAIPFIRNWKSLFADTHLLSRNDQSSLDFEKGS